MNEEEQLEIMLGAKRAEFAIKLESHHDMYSVISVKILLSKNQIPLTIWNYLVNNNVASPPTKRFFKDNFITLNIPINIKDTDNTFNIRYNQNERLVPSESLNISTKKTTILLYDTNKKIVYRETLENNHNRRSK